MFPSPPFTVRNSPIALELAEYQQFIATDMDLHMHCLICGQCLYGLSDSVVFAHYNTHDQFDCYMWCKQCNKCIHLDLKLTNIKQHYTDRHCKS